MKLKVKNGWKYIKHSEKFGIRSEFLFYRGKLMFLPIYLILFGRRFVPLGINNTVTPWDNSETRTLLITILNFDFTLTRGNK